MTAVFTTTVPPISKTLWNACTPLIATSDDNTAVATCAPPTTRMPSSERSRVRRKLRRFASGTSATSSNALCRTLNARRPAHSATVRPKINTSTLPFSSRGSLLSVSPMMGMRLKAESMI